MARAMPSWEPGFFEQESARKVERWGNMAQVWTAYETRKTAGGPVFMRGVNSLQMQWDGARWRVLSLHIQHADADTGPLERGREPGAGPSGTSAGRPSSRPSSRL